MESEVLGKDLSSCEKLIMKIVWDSEQDVSTQEIMDSLKSKYNKDYARTTVITFVQRLAEKGFVSSYRKGRVAYVHALRDEHIYKESFIRNIEEFWFMGDSSMLLSTLFKNKKPTEQEIKNLRKLIDELDN